MTKHYVTRRGFAELLGLAHTTITGYDERGLLPEPDVIVGNTKGWTEEAVLAWNANRPGRGYRTDRDPARAIAIKKAAALRERTKKANAEVVEARRKAAAAAAAKKAVASN